MRTFVLVGFLFATLGAVSEEGSHEIAVGESLELDGLDLSLTFQRVARDSRCPRDVKCIVAGEAVIVLTAIHDGDESDLTFEVPPGGSDAQDVGALTVTVEKLEPEAISSRKIADSDYVVTVSVERR